MAEHDSNHADDANLEPAEDEVLGAAGQSPTDSAVDQAFDEAEVAAVELVGGQTDAEERVLRAQAELENFRKRSRRELEEQRKYANLPLIRDLLVVLDNLSLAVSAAGDNQHAAGLLEGVKMVAEQFNNVLRQHSCQPIQSVGANFDPNLHEAVGQEPSEQFAAGVVSRELRVGYQLHDRVVRPSQVFISSGPPADQTQENASSQE